MLKRYYGFLDFNVYRKDKKNIVKYQNNVYYLEIIDDLDQIYEQYDLTKNTMCFYEFVFNKDNSIVTDCNGNKYVLLLSKNNYMPLDAFFVRGNVKLSWRDLWIKKSDYIENYYDKIRYENSLVCESFDYYLGLFELAIFYLLEYTNFYGNVYIQHKKFDYNEMHNPLNVKVDFRERDFAEYLKYIFINNEYQSVDIHNLILNNKNKYDFNLVLARVIYPNYYFDLLDEIIINNGNENDLVSIIKLSSEFEKYIKYLIDEFSAVYPIKKIPFMRF